MNCAAVTSNLLVGPCPRDPEDFAYLKSKRVTAILSLQSAEDLESEGIKGAKSAARSAKMAFRNVPVTDFDKLELKRKLPECVKALDDLISAGHTVYVHCTAGVSRSPTVAAAYLNWSLHWPLEQALDRLQEVRPCYPLGDVIRDAKPPAR